MQEMLASQMQEPWVGKESRTYGIPQPVRGSRQCNTTSTDRERENLANDDPSSRTPSGSEEEDEDGNKGNLSIDSRNVVCHGCAIRESVGVVKSDGDTDDRDQELADQHTQRTVE